MTPSTMAPAFVIPRSLRSLEDPGAVDQESRLVVQEVTDVESLSARDVEELLKGLTFELADKEVWCIEEQQIFDLVYSLIRGFSSLEASAKGSLIESLCSNFGVLNPSITALSYAALESNEDAAYMLQQIHSHRNALKIYAYFLHCILVLEEAAEPELGALRVEKAVGKRKPTQKGKKGVPVQWAWDVHRTRIVRLLATALQVDLRQLYSMSQPEESLVAFFAKIAFTLLENPMHVKDKELKEALCSIVVTCVSKYGYLEPVTSTIVNLLHKHEHLPIHLADLVTLAEEKYHDSSLLVAILQEIGGLNPEDFKHDKSGAESVGDFLVALADRVPKLMTQNLSLITPHLDSDAYKMRNAVVQVVGKLVAKASKDPSLDNAAGDETLRLRSKQRMVDILLERARDQNAYTRSKVLQTWSELCEQSAVSIGHWNLVASIAAGRLEDKGAIVRKSALHLLSTLLHYNPFGSSLRSAPFEGTLEQYKQKLEGMELVDPSADAEGAPELGIEALEVDAGRRPNKDRGHLNELQDSDAFSLRYPETQYDDSQPSQVPETMANEPCVANIQGLEQTRALVASLEAGLQFSRCIAGTMDVLKQLLASSPDDVKHTIALLIIAQQFEIDGAEASLRKMLPLVFSQDKGVCEAVERAFITIYIKESSSETALSLINLTLYATIGDLTSIEALVSKFTATGDISRSTVSALWNYFTFNAVDVTPQRSRGALVILCMAAKSKPEILSTHLQSLMDIGLGRRASDDPLLARFTCIVFQRLSTDDRASLGSHHKIFSVLSSLIKGQGLSEEIWYSTVEEAINAVYILHPTPEQFSSALLIKLFQSLFGRCENKSDGSPPASGGKTCENAKDLGIGYAENSSKHPFNVMVFGLSRFLFALAHVALKHLVYIESCVRKVWKQRADKDKAVADAVADMQASEVPSSKSATDKSKTESINDELGMAASEDARIDVLLEKAESEIVGGETNQQFLIGTMAPIVAKICRNMTLMQQNPRLRSSAMLALCKLMAIDANFCERNLPLLFTVAKNSGEAGVRSNCIIAMGDLAFRFPNLLEPWTEHMYSCLNDKCNCVRNNAVLVLSHLILNDMVKVKRHISEMALRLEDEDERIANQVKLFFHELSNKGNNPIYNLLPDILSHLSSRTDISPDHFRSVMQYLISSIDKDKQKEGLFDKLCQRFAGTSDPKQWRDLGYCLAQLSYTEKGLRKIIDLFPKYQKALGEHEVVEHFKAIIVKAKKFSKPEVKVMADEFESRILKCHEEKKEHNLAVKNAQAHQKRCNMAPNVEDDLEKHENQCKVPMDSSCEETSADNGSVMDGQEEGREDAISECSVTDNEADESSIMDKSPKYADANATKKAISCQGHPLEAAQSIYDDQEKDDFRESSEISELDMERNCETLLGSKAKLRGRSSTLVAVESDFTQDGQGEIEASSGLDSEEGESKNEFSQPLSIAKQGLKPPSTRKGKSQRRDSGTENSSTRLTRSAKPRHRVKDSSTVGLQQNYIVAVHRM